MLLALKMLWAAKFFFTPTSQSVTRFARNVHA